MQKFKGENIPSKTFKYLQYITQEEILLQEQERRHRQENAEPQQQQEQQQQQYQEYQEPVSSYQHHPNQASHPAHQQRPASANQPNYPKPVKSQPISFASSSLNLDRNQASTYAAPPATTHFDRRDASQSIFSLKQQQAPSPNLASSFSVNTTETGPTVVFTPSAETFSECSFLPSEATLNETSFVFNTVDGTTNTSQVEDGDNKNTNYIHNTCNITQPAANPTVEIKSETLYVEVTGRYFKILKFILFSLG